MHSLDSVKNAYCLSACFPTLTRAPQLCVPSGYSIEFCWVSKVNLSTGGSEDGSDQSWEGVGTMDAKVEQKMEAREASRFELLERQMTDARRKRKQLIGDVSFQTAGKYKKFSKSDHRNY